MATETWNFQTKHHAVGAPILNPERIDVERDEDGKLTVSWGALRLTGHWKTVKGDTWLDAQLQEPGGQPNEPLYVFHGIEIREGENYHRTGFFDRVTNQGYGSGDVRDTETWTEMKPPVDES